MVVGSSSFQRFSISRSRAGVRTSWSARKRITCAQSSDVRRCSVTARCIARLPDSQTPPRTSALLHLADSSRSSACIDASDEQSHAGCGFATKALSQLRQGVDISKFVLLRLSTASSKAVVRNDALCVFRSWRWSVSGSPNSEWTAWAHLSILGVCDHFWIDLDVHIGTCLYMSRSVSSKTRSLRPRSSTSPYRMCQARRCLFHVAPAALTRARISSSWKATQT